ncbi:MAG TPA: dihydrolipoyl dehydrogenase [Wenzhouxiangellaceae bacterium]|nr:dihydrolipoyl dehydrogenase [Wenzhouxiangellaceae bacterium]
MSDPSRQIDVDVAVIGAGSAGLVAFRQASKHADRVVLVEGGPYGTTCARVGCMPSKLLISAAETAHSAQHAGRFGIHPESVRIDGKEVMERVRRERDRFVGFVLDSVDKIPSEQKIKGTARFDGPNSLSVEGGPRINAQRIVIATGSRTHIVGFLKDAGSRLVTNDEVFDWTDLPESVAVFGPGVIGLEIGQALSRLGVRVRMFGVGGFVGPIKDPEIRKIALETFNSEFPLDPDAETTGVSETDSGVEISFRDQDGNEVSETFEYLLAATGRRPNVDGLGLEHAGLALDERGVPEFDRYTLRCGDSPVFIAGDVNNELPLLHEAADEGRIAGANAGRYPDVQTGNRRVPISVVFTDPQIATVGLTIQQTDERCRGCFAVGSVNFENQGRSRVIGKNRGLLRVYGEHGTGRFMGAEMFGPAAEHIAHLLAWAAQQRMDIDQMLGMPFYHPVIEEGLRTALRALHDQLKLGPESADECMDCGPGT